MAEGRDRQLWAHTAQVTAAIMNVPSMAINGKMPYTPAQFNLYERAKIRARREHESEQVNTKAQFGLIRGMFCKRKR